ncbi:NAD(P)H-dependent oxidoreductase [Gymnodinialimonas ulvae]|uniref:NAD(P)H-dependent oxidoreductase n=1 Tax=Gymnodinialimonas ulvae TaxID=3126504 RepID=UPI0030A04BE0
MTKRIFILNGHPGRTSMSRSMVEAYAEAARAAGHAVRVAHISELQFDPDFGEGSYREVKALEPDLQAVADAITWAQHVVLICPMWWGAAPAKLKGLIDRVLIPGFAMDTRRRRFGAPLPLLTGRTARLVVTSDTPDWYFRLVYGRNFIQLMRKQVFGFVGIKPMRATHFTMASKATNARVARWLDATRALGARAG